MKLYEALAQFDDGLYEPLLIVLHDGSYFPREIHFKIITRNSNGELSRYGVGATDKATLSSLENWFTEKGPGRTLDGLVSCIQGSNHWQLLTATQFIALIQHIFQTRKEPEI